MGNTPTVTLKKSVRKDGSRAGWSMLWYALISMAVSILWMLGETIIRAVIRTKDITDTAEKDRIFDEVFTYVSEQSGTYMIVGVLVALGFLFLYFRKSGIAKTMFRSEQKMTPSRFGGIACAFFGFQIIFQCGYMLMETLLNLIGYTAESSMEMASAGSQTVSMFLYAGLIGPIVEELVYRGFVMRLLEKHGKLLAVVISSILFGAMHANLPQSIFAFFVGLILGYVAIEYSIKWSIVLHILNNMVLGDLMSMTLGDCSEFLQNIVFYSVNGLFLLIGIIFCIRRRKELGAWIRNNMWEKPKMRWIMTTVGIILFVVLHLLLGISMLEKLVN